MPDSRTSIYQSHLDRVSRSFAFCIARLPEGLREEIGLSYLLCRVLDTVEDAKWPSSEKQQKAFDEFMSFLDKKPNSNAIANWVQVFPNEIAEGEKLLLDDCERLLSDFHALPAETCEAMRAPILSMARGMRHFSKKSSGGILRLQSLSELQQYCFFVAGVVGEILTRLVQNRLRTWHLRPTDFENAVHFGLFLQKVNILKDQVKDEREGRYFIASRSKLLASLRQNAVSAFSYIESVPSSMRAYRVFCCWSFFLAMASLPWLQMLSEDQENVRINRDEAMNLYGHIESVVDDPGQLKAQFEQLLQGMTAESVELIASHDDLVSQLYSGAIPTESLRKIGL